MCTSLIAVSTAVRSRVTKTASEKRLLRTNSAARRSVLLRQPSSTSFLLISPGLRTEKDDDDDDVELHVLGCRVDILGTNCDQCLSTVQRCFTSTETVRLIRTESPERPPPLSHMLRQPRTATSTFTHVTTAQDGHLHFHTCYDSPAPPPSS